MSINKIIVIMLAIFILEGSLLPWIIPEGFGTRIIPHFTFVMVMYAAIYSSRYYALGLGLGFGLLQDILFYGNVIGTHFFFVGIIGYTVGIMFERKRVSILAVISIIGIACLVYDSAVYGINYVFQMNSGSYAWALLEYILPSLFLQLFFVLVVYIPTRKMFEGLITVQYSDVSDEAA